jgi:hypothetical protein
MPLPSDVQELSYKDCSWCGFRVAHYTCIRCAHEELLAGVLDEAWMILLDKLYDIQDDKAHVSQYFYCWQPKSMPLARILANSGTMSTEAIVEAVLADPRYPADRVFLCVRRNATLYVKSLESIEVSAVPHDERCPICRAGFEEAVPEDWDHTIRKTACGHLYGQCCLIEALTASADCLCPYCRQDLSRNAPSRSA